MPGATCIRARSAFAIAHHSYTEHSLALIFNLSQRASTCCRATQAASQFLTVGTGRGQGIPRTALYCIMLQPYFQAGRCDAVRSQHLGRAGKAGPGRADLPSAASMHVEGPTSLNVTYSTGQPAASRTRPGLENCSQVSHYQCRACFGFLTSLPAMTLPPSQALSGGTSPWPGYTPNWEGLPHPALQTKHTLRQAPASTCYQKPKIKAAGYS